MGAVSLLFSVHSFLPPPAGRRPGLRWLPTTSAPPYPTSTATLRLLHRVPVAGAARSEGGGRAPGDGESAFLDEDGMVKDMDGYLDYLSLEYDSVWDTKPSWCQPWTILLTGVTVSTCSWVLLRSVLATAVISSLICGWWYIFLYAYPKEYSEMIAERRKNVVTGVEDTFGTKKTENPQF